MGGSTKATQRVIGDEIDQIKHILSLHKIPSQRLALGREMRL